eukprot:8336252-Pyramimonas_sp.AAC.1
MANCSFFEGHVLRSVPDALEDLPDGLVHLWVCEWDGGCGHGGGDWWRRAGARCKLSGAGEARFEGG